jgi:putative transposase
VGDCCDNAVAESFFATLKRECVRGVTYAIRQEARQQLFEFIEVVL